MKIDQRKRLVQTVLLNRSLRNILHFLNPLLANIPILYPLKTPENLRFSSVFRGYKMGILARSGLRQMKTFTDPD